MPLHLQMPPDFPLAEYEAVSERLASANRAGWSEWAGGWNGLAYRFRSCAESDEAFTASIQRAGSAPPPEERYIQERELFSFFVAGFSSVESLCFAIFGVGAMLRSADFPIRTAEDLRRVSPENTARLFGEAYSGDDLSVALQPLADSQEIREWKMLRNVLAHREAPARHISPAVVPTWFNVADVNLDIRRGTSPIAPRPVATAELALGMLLDEGTTASRRRWLSDRLTVAVRAAKDFVRREF